MPWIIIRCAVSSMPAASGTARARIPSRTKTIAKTNARKKLVITPAEETSRSPRTKFLYFRGLTGTGLAPPKVNRPLDPNQSSVGSSRLIQGSMWGIGFRVTRPRR